MDFIKLKPSSTFLSVLEELHTCPGAPKSIKNYFAYKEKWGDESSPSTELLLLTGDVKWCHERMRERGVPHRIHQLINQSEVILPAYEPPPRNPELEARVQKLRNEQSNAEYRRMTRNLAIDERGAVTSVGKELREMHREVNRQLVTGFQYMVSIVGTFFALYVGLTFATHEFVPRLVIAIIGALTVGLAEIYFIIREDIREEAQRNKKK